MDGIGNIGRENDCKKDLDFEYGVDIEILLFQYDKEFNEYDYDFVILVCMLNVNNVIFFGFFMF